MEKLPGYVDSIRVEFRPAVDSKTLVGWCNVEINFVDDARFEIMSVGVVHIQNKAPFISYPQRKSEQRFFDLLRVRGPLHEAISQACLAKALAYEDSILHPPAATSVPQASNPLTPGDATGSGGSASKRSGR